MTSENSDIISDLPYEIKVKLLEYLPITDAVRSSILSTKWRYVWALLRKLVFDEKYFISDDGDVFPELVDRFLLLHDGPILQFHVMMKFKLSAIIDRWILVVSRKKVQNFKLVLSGPLDVLYQVHSSLFSCHEMRDLWLANCSVTIPRNFKGLGKLKTLKLHDIVISDDDLNYLVSSCTHLQHLELIWSENDNSLHIEGNVGQKLTISEFDLISISANVPTNLLAGQFIMQMNVCGGELIIPQNFQGLDKLESLSLNNAIFSPNKLKNLILGCTQLNEFSASILHGPDELKIHSNSLQCLKIHSFKHLHLVAPLLHTASFNLFFQENGTDDRLYIKLLEEEFNLLEAMADLYTKLTPTSTFDHLVNLLLTVKFGDMVSEYALLCFVKKAKAVQSLEIEAISLQEYMPNIISLQEYVPNIWQFAMFHDSKFIFDQLLIVRFDGFLGTENELSFLTFIVAASPVLKRMTIAPRGRLLTKSIQTYRKMLRSRRLSSRAVITFV